MPLGRNNFIIMAVAGVMIVLGFLLMLGGSSTNEAFNPDIFSTRRIVVGPAICFLGFVLMAIATQKISVGYGCIECAYHGTRAGTCRVSANQFVGTP